MCGLLVVGLWNFFLKMNTMEKEQLISEINRLRKEKNAVILAHYYQVGEIQDVADVVGDSLALAQWAEKSDADILVVCGVHFMGETAKILSPQKKVLVPDLAAGCSLADSCNADEFGKFVAEHPDYTVISYVNTTAAVKAHTDVVVTSTNARKIVDQFPKDAKLIFGPDRNLGGYINAVTGRNMLLWNGACHVHEQFSLEKLIELKAQYSEAKVLVHPECKKEIADLADVVGSTQALLNYAVDGEFTQFLVCTESGILHEMQKRCPEKEFIPVPPAGRACANNECDYMRMNTLEKLYLCLRDEQPAIEVDEAIRERAVRPIHKMLEMSK